METCNDLFVITTLCTLSGLEEYFGIPKIREIYGTIYPGGKFGNLMF